MTELGLIVGINVAGLLFAGLLARWLVARETGGPSMRRLGGAIERAVGAFLGSQYRLVALLAMIVCAVLFGLHGLLGLIGKPAGGAHAAFWLGLATIVGAASLCVVIHVAARLALLGSLRSSAASQKSLDRGLCVALRAGAVAGLIAEAVSALALLSVFALVYAMKGGFSAPPDQAAALSFEVALLCAGFAMGAAGAALLVQRGGSVYHVAADVGGDLAGVRDAGLDHDDPRNPSLVTELVGDHVGVVVARTADLFVSGAVANVAAIILGTRVLVSRGADSALLALVTLPLVVRAFGVVASGFGVMVVRTNDVQNPASALWRGYLTTLIVSIGGLFGACLWLLGDAWLKVSLAGSAGIVAAFIASYFAGARATRRSSAVREVMDALRIGEAPSVAQAMAGGLSGSLVPTLILGIALTLAWQLGAGTAVPQGSLFAMLTALMAMLAAGPYVLAVGAFASIADNAVGVGALQAGSAGEDGQRRAARLDEAGFWAAAGAQNYLILVGAASTLLAALSLPVLVDAQGVDLTKPAVAMSGALGAAFVLAYMGNAIRCSARGARGVALEVERQLRGFPRDGGLAQVPRDYTPSYRACIDLTARSALEGTLRSLILALLPPAILGIGLSLMYRSTDPRLAVEGLASFVVVATATALAASLAVDSTRATLSVARRLSKPRGSSAGFAASVGSNALAGIMGNAAGPAAHFLVKATAITSIVLVPLLS